MAQGKKNNIDPEQVRKLAERFYTKQEIASFFDVHVDTITNNFQELYEKGKENGKAKLRELQLAAAIKGNVTMLIWLGKQYLGQTEKLPEIEPTKRDYEIIFEVRDEENEA